MADTFRYNDRIYPYFTAEYQNTRLNERAVEVSIALDFFNGGQSVLEVGAVLPHYLPDWPDCAHTVVDLHEEYPGVINEDVLTFTPPLQNGRLYGHSSGTYDLIICISTLDHLNNADEVIEAVERMKAWLKPGGLLFATVPANQPSKVGGGQWLDTLVLSGALDLPTYRMDKTDPDNHGWRQVDSSTPARLYGQPTTWANTVYLFEWRR